MILPVQETRTEYKKNTVCLINKIAYASIVLQKQKDQYPEWFEEKKAPDDIFVTAEEQKELKPMPFIAMIASVGKNDDKRDAGYRRRSQ